MPVRTLSIQNNSENSTALISLYFDGKIDKTVNIRTVYSIADPTQIVKEYDNIKEEHMLSSASREVTTLIMYYLFPQLRRFNISKVIISVIHSTLSTSKLEVVGCYGCPTNTGKHNGIIRRIELELCRPLQWSICILHMNELPLRALIVALDGPTKGPSSYSGKISSAINIQDTEFGALPIENFKIIPGLVNEIADYVLNEMNNDQQYLYKICLSIQNGREWMCQSGVVHILPGKIHNARWVTTANRILRLYTSQKRPNTKVQRLMNYILNVFSPMWFKIRTQPTIVDGARNFFYLISLSQNLKAEDKLVVEPAIQRNSYWAHPENILLTSLNDNCKEVLKIAVNVIYKHELTELETIIQ